VEAMYIIGGASGVHEPDCEAQPVSNGAAAAMSDLVAAVEGFLGSLVPHAGAPEMASLPGYVCSVLGGYRLLRRECNSREAEPPPCIPPVILLADKEGAVYLAEALGPERQAVEACLRRRGLRPAGSTLTLRLPDEHGGQVATFALWASPRYLADRGLEAALWK